MSALVAGCSVFSDKDPALDPMELFDIETSVKVKRVWSKKIGGEADFLRVALRPIGDGNRLYAASRDGNVTALNPETGKQIWRTKLDIGLTAGPGTGEGLVAVASEDGFVIVLDAANGNEVWRVNVEGEALATPLIKGESIIVQTIDNNLKALSLFDGSLRWSIQQTTPVLTMRGSATPVIAGSTVIAGFDSGRLVAANIDTGTIVWEGLLSPPQGRSDLDRLADIDGSLALVGQDVYAAGYQGRIASMAVESGQVLWSREFSSAVGVSADWNSLYSTRADGAVVALTRRNGTETWRYEFLLRRELTLPVPFGTTVVVGDLEGYLHFFSTIDGTPVARLRFGKEAITSAPLVIANRLYVQSDSGHIAAYVIVDDRPKRTQPDVADDES